MDVVLNQVASLSRADRRSEGFQVLKKGLQYAISVVVAAAPDLGFPLISRWAGVDDSDVRTILRTNLRKARLAQRFPDRVAELFRLLDAPRA